MHLETNFLRVVFLMQLMASKKYCIVDMIDMRLLVNLGNMLYPWVPHWNRSVHSNSKLYVKLDFNFAAPGGGVRYVNDVRLVVTAKYIEDFELFYCSLSWYFWRKKQHQFLSKSVVSEIMFPLESGTTSSSSSQLPNIRGDGTIDAKINPKRSMKYICRKISTADMTLAMMTLNIWDPRYIC